MGTSHKLHFGGQVSPNPVDPPPIDQLHLHSLAIRKCIDIVMFLSAPNNRCVFTATTVASSRVISSQEKSSQMFSLKICGKPSKFESAFDQEKGK